MIDQTEVVELNLLRSIAWKFYHKYGIEFEELFSEACLAYTRARPSYKAGKSQLSTFITTVVVNHLISWSLRIIKRTRVDTNEVPLDIADWRMPDAAILFKAQVQALHRHAKQICQMIIENPDTYEEMSKGDLYKHLRKLGWEHTKITKSFNEIKTALHV